MTAVYDALLEDMILPGRILGKRVRVRLDGSQLLKVFVNEKKRNYFDDKRELLEHVYHKLTNRRLAISFKPEESFVSVSQK